MALPEDSEPPLHLSGNTLEGGGQVVRIAVGLSALTHRSVHLTSIRGARGKGGGLKHQHLQAVAWLAEACEADIDGLHLGSRTLTFRPREIKVGGSNAIPADTWPLTRLSDGTQAHQINISAGEEKNGALTLILQAIQPYLFFSGATERPLQSKPLHSVAPSASTIPAHEWPTPIHLTMAGGTHVPSAPTLPYVHHIFMHNLRTLYPTLPPLISPSTDPNHKPRNGWASGPHLQGRASFFIRPLPRGTTLPPFTIPRPPLPVKIETIYLVLLAPGEDGKSALTEAAFRGVEDAFFPSYANDESHNPDNNPHIWLLEDGFSGHNSRWFVMLIAQQTNGLRIGRDHVFQGRVGKGGDNRRKEIARMVVEKVVGQLREEVKEVGGGLDRRLWDQVAVFQGLAAGVSGIVAGNGERDSKMIVDAEERNRKRKEMQVPEWDTTTAASKPENYTPFDPTKPTTHTLTARWATETVLSGAEWSMDSLHSIREGHCDGVGFVIGSATHTAGVGKRAAKRVPDVILGKYEGHAPPDPDEDDEPLESDEIGDESIENASSVQTVTLEGESQASIGVDEKGEWTAKEMTAKELRVLERKREKMKKVEEKVAKMRLDGRYW